MGRPKKYHSPAARQAAYRARQRQAAGKPAPLSAEQRRAADREQRARDVAAIRRNLIEKGGERGRELADKLYPSTAGTTP
jgi:hypothetical protein